MLIGDLITRSPVTIGPEVPIVKAARLMRDEEVGSLVVVEKGEIVGILTDRDIVVDLVAANGDAEFTTVGKIMTPNPICITVTSDIEQCLDRMEHYGVRRIPVLNDGGNLVGVVALDDILMQVGRQLGKAGALIRKEVAGNQKFRRSLRAS